MVELSTKLAVSVATATAQQVARWTVEKSKHYAVEAGNSLMRSFLHRRAEHQVLRDAKRWPPKDCAYVALAPQAVGMRVKPGGGAELHTTICFVPRAPFGLLPDTASLTFELGDGRGFSAKAEKMYSFNAGSLAVAPVDTQLSVIFPPRSFEVATQEGADPIALTLEVRGALYFRGPWPNEPKPSVPVLLKTWCVIFNCAPPRTEF